MPWGPDAVLAGAVVATGAAVGTAGAPGAFDSDFGADALGADV